MGNWSSSSQPFRIVSHRLTRTRPPRPSASPAWLEGGPEGAGSRWRAGPTDHSFRQDLQDVQDISRPFPPIKSGVTRGTGSAKKKVGGKIAQEALVAGRLISEHQAIFGEQRATKIGELIFASIDSPKILLSDCCIQSIKSCASCLIKFSESLRAPREIYMCVICLSCEMCLRRLFHWGVICGLNLRPKRYFRLRLRRLALQPSRRGGRVSS